MFFWFAINTTFSQIINPEIDRILNEVTQNNTTLLTHKQQVEAQSLLLKTGLNPPDPEFEAAYFNGDPSIIGNRTNLSLTQAFDFPSTYFHKNKIAKQQINQLSVGTEEMVKDIQFETRLVCLNLIYQNALYEIFGKRLEHAVYLEESYKKLLEAGEISLMDYNKTRINLMNLQQKAEMIEIKRNELNAELTRLNGGETISLQDTVFGIVQLPADFEQWYETAEKHHPEIKYLKNLTEIRQREEKLQRSLSLPSFKVGYVSEELANEKFEGMMAGISIPLWQNRNTVKYAKANILLVDEELAGMKNDIFNTLRKEYQTATSLKSTLHRYNEIVTETQKNTDLLYKAWQKGEKGLTEYLIEISYYYEIDDNRLQTEFNLFLSAARLYRYFNDQPE